MKCKILILFIIISSLLFSANFEFAFGAGATTEFSYALDREENNMFSGDRVDSDLSVTDFLDIGANFELPNGGF
ncbi:hypothetical protein [uncultured Brachyspira sp.]|uniref:hypothetical protein n=1 Tax=uncultured Brachyspira sp. TaxID=221953 RepID=UPI0025837450|nr:hypothetical protein [uncultured Brachyspira sp.]